MTFFIVWSLIIVSVFLGMIGYTIATIGGGLTKMLIEVLVELRRTNMILLMDMQDAADVSVKDKEGKVISSLQREMPDPKTRKTVTFTTDV